MQLELLRQAESLPTSVRGPQAYIPRLAIDPGTSVKVVCLADTFFRTSVSYDSYRGRTLWCGHPLDESCDNCRLHHNVRLSAFMMVCFMPSRSLRVFDCPEACYRECAVQRNLDGFLRGREISVTRGAAKKNSALRFTASLAANQFPAGLYVPDVREVLVTLFSYTKGNTR